MEVGRLVVVEGAGGAGLDFEGDDALILQVEDAADSLGLFDGAFVGQAGRDDDGQLATAHGEHERLGAFVVARGGAQRAERALEKLLAGARLAGERLADVDALHTPSYPQSASQRVGVTSRSEGA